MKCRLFSVAAAGFLLASMSAGVYAAESGSKAVTANSSEAAPAAQTATTSMPDPDQYTGLSRKVIEYSHAFNELIEKTKQPGFSAADWEPIEALVDVEDFERMGVFLGPQAEVIDWETYKGYVSQYGANTSWDGKLRRITEVPGLVILELEEHNTVNGKTGISNTVTIYEFNDAGEIEHLDVYVMPLP